LHQYTGASDLIVTRAGANTLAEIGVQGKACIVIPNPLLTGGHQLKNADYFANENAVSVVHEADLHRNQLALDRAIRDLLDSQKERARLGSKLQELTITNATQQLAVVLLDVAKSKPNKKE